MRPHPLLIQLAMVLTMVLWGVSFVASKIVLDQIGPLPYMGVRFSLAAIVLAFLMAVLGRPRFSLRTHGLIALTALSEPIAYFLFESYGLRIIGATTTSLIIDLFPSGADAGDLSAAAVAAIDPILRTTGVLLVLGAVFSAAGYITLARSLTQKHDPIRLTIVQTWWGAAFFFTLWQVTTPGTATVAEITPIVWGAIAFLVIGATVLAFMLYNWALKYERAGTAALYINAIPVITAFTSWIVLGETLVPIQLLGAFFVLAAVRFSSYRSTVQAATTITPEA
jgi:drug/metabolite transporter (DMT)-like permease